MPQNKFFRQQPIEFKQIILFDDQRWVKTTQKTEEQTKRCFTGDMVTTNKTLTELSFLCNRLRAQIDLRVDASTSSKLRPSTINFLKTCLKDER